MTMFLVVMSMLAVWRVTHMLQNEDGPDAIFARLQAWAARQPEKIGSFPQGFLCFNCLSVWISFLPALALQNSLHEFFIYLFAISAGAMIIDTVHYKLEQ
jgi:hypothetical protein